MKPTNAYALAAYNKLTPNQQRLVDAAPSPDELIDAALDGITNELDRFRMSDFIGWATPDQRNSDTNICETALCFGGWVASKAMPNAVLMAVSGAVRVDDETLHLETTVDDETLHLETTAIACLNLATRIQKEQLFYGGGLHDLESLGLSQHYVNPFRDDKEHGFRDLKTIIAAVFPHRAS